MLFLYANDSFATEWDVRKHFVASIKQIQVRLNILWCQKNHFSNKPNLDEMKMRFLMRFWANQTNELSLLVVRSSLAECMQCICSNDFYGMFQFQNYRNHSSPGVFHSWIRLWNSSIKNSKVFLFTLSSIRWIRWDERNGKYVAIGERRVCFLSHDKCRMTQRRSFFVSVFLNCVSIDGDGKKTCAIIWIDWARLNMCTCFKDSSQSKSHWTNCECKEKNTRRKNRERLSVEIVK